MSGRSSFPRLAAGALAIGIVAAICAAPPVAAQGTPGLLDADEEMVQRLLKPRSIEELGAEYESAKRRAAESEQDLADAAPLVPVAQTRVRVKKDEIALLKTRLKLARREKNESDRAELEKSIEREERGLEVFEAMREATAAQKERAEAAVEFARARISMQAAELALAQKRESRVTAPIAPGDLAARTAADALDAEIRRAAREALVGLRDYAKKSKRLAEATGDLAKARLALLDAWEGYRGR